MKKNSCEHIVSKEFQSWGC